MFNNDKEYEVDFGNLFSVTMNKKIPLREGITGCFDWLSCTFNCFSYEADNDFTYAKLTNESQHKIKELLKFFNRENDNLFSFDRESGANGFKYKICLQEGCYLLFYGPTTINGCASTGLNVTGVGCQWLISHGKFYGLLKYLLDYAYRFTRFDSAIDNYTNIMPLSHVDELVKKRSYISIFKNPFKVTGTPNPDSNYGYDGVTYYLGNASDILVRIYAKNWKEEKQEEIKDWTRWEIQLRDHERIKQLVTLIILGYEENDYSDYFNIVASILKEILMFKIPGKNKQKTRWEDDPEYLKFLNEVNGIKLFHSPKGKSEFDISKAWFEKSCTLFLTQICMIYGEDKFFRYIKYLITDKFSDMKENNYNLVINEFERLNKKFNINEISKMMNKFEKEFNRYEFDSSLKDETMYQDEKMLKAMEERKKINEE